MRTLLNSLFISGSLLLAGLAGAVTSPEQHLGRPAGTDFELADWEQVSSWYRLLAEESPLVTTESVGTSTEGRDFLLSIITSEANHARMDELKRHAEVIADPRGRSDAEKDAAIKEGRVFLFVSPQMHSTEAAGTEAAMEFVYTLVTSDEEPWASARENLVVGVFACTNPDGLDHVSHWYREHVGTPFEAAGMLELYQKYTGHDNNRDWFMLTQTETRIVTEQLYTVWRPQVYWDIHQQGGTRERFFVPPYRDPLNPNLDPALVAGIDAIGSRALMDMTRRGLTGISTGVTYDMWWNGGNRSTPARHNIMGLLTEAASVDLATPVFLRTSDLSAPGHLAEYGPSNNFPHPWPGGWWRLRDIVDYQVAFGESIVGSLTRERAFWLRNAMEAAERIIARGEESGPRAWIIPSDNRDPDAVRRLADVLIRSGIELHLNRETLSADGRDYPAGSIVILQNQPYAAHVKDLFEVQRYPKGTPPYDVAGWTVPLLMGVHRVEVMGAIEAPLDQVATADEATAAFSGIAKLDVDRWTAPGQHSSTWTQVFARLTAGNKLEFLTNGDHRGHFVETPVPGDASSITLESLPRIGLYAPWSPSMDEGWMRWVLDTWEVPYITVRNEQIRAGELHKFIDVLLLPSMGQRSLDEGRPLGSIPNEFARGLAPEGAAAIEEFVRTGGRLITLEGASDWAIDLLQLPIINVLDEKENSDFSCPGSVLRAIPSNDAPIAAGLPNSMAVFFSRSAAYRPMTKDERNDTRREEMPTTSLLRYAPARVLLSGWIQKPEAIEGRDAWVHVKYGEGDVHLFAFRPHYRAWTQGTFPLVFRAMLL